MKLKKSMIVFIIFIFLFSTVASASLYSFNNPQNNLFENGLISQFNSVSTSQTINNTTRDALIHNASDQMREIEKYANGTNLTVVEEFTGQNLETLKNDVSNSKINTQTKRKILININLAIESNNQTMAYLIDGNLSQAQNRMRYEKTILDTIKSQISNEISNSSSSNLTQTINLIETGQDNGGAWILNNTPFLSGNSTEKFYQNIEAKTDDLQNTIKQLKDGGVQMDVQIVNTSNLQDNGDGTFTLKNSTNTTLNSSTKPRIIPLALVIIFAGGMVLEINNAVMAGLATDDEVNYFLRTHPTEIVCGDCKFRMYALNLLGLTGGTLITWGISIYCMDTLLLIRLGFEMIEYSEFISDFSGEILSQAFSRVDNLMSDGCNEPRCMFYKEKRRDLAVGLQAPDKAFLNLNNSVSAVVFNTKYGTINQTFKVTLYENSTPGPDPTNYTPIATQTVSGLGPKSNKTLNFNWVPTYKGQHVLKVIADPDNIINETNEYNNAATKIVTVDDFIYYLKLYYIEKENSTSDPSQYAKITYYFMSDHPILLNPGQTPTFVYETSNPVYSNVGFQAFYPYGAMWQQYSSTGDINGTWYSCYTNPYNICSENVTDYRVTHWASGSGHYQYFRVIMKTQPVWMSGIVKTNLEKFGVVETAK